MTARLIYIKNKPDRRQTITFMKPVSIVWRRLVRAAMVGILMLLIPAAASASANRTDDCALVAGSSSPVHQDAIRSPASGGTLPTSDHRLHCHLLSTLAMAVGAIQSRDDGKATAPARVVPTLAAHYLGRGSALASPLPIAAPAPYILFGNFRR